MSAQHYGDHAGFSGIVRNLSRDLVSCDPVEVNEWQAQRVQGTPLAETHELQNCVIEYSIPDSKLQLQAEVEPNLPWAEDHFQERVSGTPWNPPPSAAYWPFAVKGHEDHVEEGKFSHTYPERMWPKMAGDLVARDGEEIRGLRYEYGDVVDLLKLLAREPTTRQAYLPIWFPEDLDAAANHQQRVPCTLGYHFLLRDGLLHCFYPIRSCDFVRHFRDDVYMAARLCQWVIYREQGMVVGAHRTSAFLDYMDMIPNPSWQGIKPGTLTMHAVSMHCFAGDISKLRREYIASSK